METHRRRSDGRRLFTASFKQEQLARLARGDLTPAASPQSNGMSEAFVNTVRRDNIAGADLASAPECWNTCPRGSPITIPSRPTQHSAINHPSSIGRAGARQVSHASPKLSHEMGDRAPLRPPKSSARFHIVVPEVRTCLRHPCTQQRSLCG